MFKRPCTLGMSVYTDNVGSLGCGLFNKGNTCFINATVQCLARVKCLRAALDHSKYNDRLVTTPYSKVLDEWNRLSRALLVERGQLDPQRFIEAIGVVCKDNSVSIKLGAQNDAGEFLSKLLEFLHEATAAKVDMKVNGQVSTDKDKIAETCYNSFKKEYENKFSPVIDLFNGISIGGMSEPQGGAIASTLVPAMFNTLTLPLPMMQANVALKDCFSSYCQDTLLDGDNSWFDETLGAKREVVRWTRFWSLPKVLIIEFPRRAMPALFKGGRDRRPVHTPLDSVDLSDFIAGYVAKSYVYDVIGLCYHLGNSLSGHYTAACRISGSNWAYFDDGQVGPIDAAKLITGDVSLMFLLKQS